MRRRTLIVLILTVASAWVLPALESQERPESPSSYAVMNLYPRAGASLDEIGPLSDALAEALSQKVSFPVLDRGAMNQALSSGGFFTTSYASMEAVGVRAGEMVQARFILLGALSRLGGEYVLETWLVDTQREAIVRRATTRQAADWSGFLTRAPVANIDSLFQPDSFEPSLAEPAAAPVATAPGAATTATVAGPAERTSWSPPFALQFPSLDGRLSAGLRMQVFSLLEDTSESFVGSINALYEEQSFIPTPYVSWQLNEYWSLRSDWERFAAETGTEESRSDGVFRLNGLSLLGLFRLPNESICTPYVGGGFAYYTGEFDASGWWHLGFHSPAEWQAEGSPSQAFGGITQKIDVDNTFGLILEGGGEFWLNERWTLDLFLRYVNLEATVHHIIMLNGVPLAHQHGPRDIPFDHLSAGAGVRYTF